MKIVENAIVRIDGRFQVQERIFEYGSDYDSNQASTSERPVINQNTKQRQFFDWITEYKYRLMNLEKSKEHLNMLQGTILIIRLLVMLADEQLQEIRQEKKFV